MNRAAFLEAIRDFANFRKQQISMYIDALSAFSRNKILIEQRVARIQVPSSVKKDKDGHNIMMMVSLEDPSRPDCIHLRIVRADDYIADNAIDGANEQQHARAVIVFIYTYWELEIRPRLAAATEQIPGAIKADIFGDLRLIRNHIFHEKGVMTSDLHKRLRKLRDMFEVDKPIVFSNERMDSIFRFMAQDAARLTFEYLGVTDPPVNPDDFRDIAIQRSHKP